ncbi:hypothetical protein [Nocardia bhagyanarayanae]|uniref:hypothetical protein n=1 Tax=Nocardia bhagyanarayanae TaxID=1215925 RepID=UPI001FE9D7FE|nr:hypothetical protein [Nocardia bhagyanarayanae]
MKNIALELAPHGIRCNALCPGADTPMIDTESAYDLFAGGSGGTRAHLDEAPTISTPSRRGRCSTVRSSRIPRCTSTPSWPR